VLWFAFVLAACGSEKTIGVAADTKAAAVRSDASSLHRAGGTAIPGSYIVVLDCNGSGSTSGIISALNWLSTNYIAPAVANMSLGGGYSSSLNSAVNNLAASGAFVAVAAGNSNADACNYSPASAANTTTVAASDRGDNRASYSNYGGCVDLYGPGSAITSDWLNGGTNTISGVDALKDASNGERRPSSEAAPAPFLHRRARKCVRCARAGGDPAAVSPLNRRHPWHSPSVHSGSSRSEKRPPTSS
jgi:hypothetical protein